MQAGHFSTKDPGVTEQVSADTGVPRIKVTLFPLQLDQMLQVHYQMWHGDSNKNKCPRV